MAVAMDNAILENILRQVRPLIGQGKVADYIPALATVDGSRLGIAIRTRGSLPGGWDYRQNLALVAVLWRLFRMKWPSQSGVRNWMMPVTRLRALPSLNN